MKRSAPSLTLQLLTFLILPLLILLVVVAIGGTALHQSAMRDQLASHNLQVVVGTAAEISAQMAQRQAILNALAAELETPQGAEALLQRSDSWLRTLFDGGVAVYTVDGTPVGGRPSGTAWRTAGQWLASHPGELYLAVPDENGLDLLIRSRPEVRLQIVGLASFPSLGMTDLLASLHAGANTAVFLGDSRGETIFRSSSLAPQALQAAQAYLATLSGAGTSPFQTTVEDLIVTVAAIPAAGWTLVQVEQAWDAINPWLRYTQAAPLVLLPGILIAVIAVWFGLQRIVHPLQRLEAQANDLAWGNFDPIQQDVGGIEEIRRLQTTLRHLSQRIQAVQAGMHNYIGAITHAQEEERARLARELHDQTAQALVALDHRQQMLKPFLQDNPQGAALLTEIRKMIAESLDDLRRIVRAMRPIYLEELGLAPALKMLASDLDVAIDVHFSQHGSPRRLRPEEEIALYRIAQEAFNNAWQHSAAQDIWLSVTFSPDRITIAIRDNGQGFHAPRHASDLPDMVPGHFGVMGMYERASLIGAHLQIRSAPGQGTQVIVDMPLPPQSEEKLGMRGAGEITPVQEEETS